MANIFGMPSVWQWEKVYVVSNSPCGYYLKHYWNVEKALVKLPSTTFSWTLDQFYSYIWLQIHCDDLTLTSDQDKKKKVVILYTKKKIL